MADFYVIKVDECVNCPPSPGSYCAYCDNKGSMETRVSFAEALAEFTFELQNIDFGSARQELVDIKQK